MINAELLEAELQDLNAEKLALRDIGETNTAEYEAIEDKIRELENELGY